MSTPQIYQLISKVMNDVQAVGKEGKNDKQKYDFRKIDDVVNMIHPILKKHQVFLVPEVMSETREERLTSSGGRMHYSIIKVKYTFFAPDGSSITSSVVGEGADSGDKASNKAMSAAFKYALCQVFAIPFEEDDSEKTSPEIAPRPPIRNHAPGAENKPVEKNNEASSPPDGGDELEDQISRLVEKFRQVGVSEKMIVARYQVRHIGALDQKMVSELQRIGRDIVNKRSKVEDHFKR